MRADYEYKPYTIPSKVQEWIHRYHSAGTSLSALLETRDAPEWVLTSIQVFVDHRKDWEDGAKDRPFTLDRDGYPRRRLFDGRWIPEGPLSSFPPTTLEATFTEEETEERGTYVRKVVLPWEMYEQAIARDDEEACREIADAIYAWVDGRASLDRMLVALLSPD